MYRDIVIPTYDLVLLVIAAGLIGYWLGKFITEWRNLK